MITVRANSVTDSFLQLVALFNDGVAQQEFVGRSDATDNGVKVLRDVMVQIDVPERRLIMNSKRKPNPFAKLYETLWVLAGKTEVNDLEFFMKRARQWADDGVHWRAGYGGRLRDFTGRDDNDCCTEVDQLDYVYRVLRADPTSRRAVISIWDPVKEGTIGKSKDFPCSGYLVFSLQHGRLNCNFTQRSCDLLWGYSHINVYEWTVMQEILAKSLGCSVGYFVHNIVNLHMYDKYMHRIQEIGDEVFMADKVSPFEFPGLLSPMGSHVILQRVKEYLNLEKPFNLRKEFGKNIQFHSLSSQVVEILTYLSIYILFKKGQLRTDYEFDIVFQQLGFTDMKVACHNFLARNLKWPKINSMEDSYQAISKNVPVIY